MATYVALLFSVVLGPGRRLAMADLRAMASRLGLDNPRTAVATGNLLFETPSAPRGRLEGRLETAFADAFGRHVDIIVRPAADWPKLIAANPFPEQSETDPAHVLVRVGRSPLAADIAEALEPYRAGEERIVAVGHDLWVHFAHGVGSSRLAAAITHKRLGSVGTSRNWNTIRRIGDKLAG